MIATQMNTTITLHESSSFGNGAHPSTYMVIELLHDLKAQGFDPSNALDIGCGTGILSIITAKLFNIPIIAVDIAKDAVYATQSNATLNEVNTSIHALQSQGFSHSAIAKHAPYDLILFNILAQTATQHAHHANKLMATKGLIILSGILQWQAPAVIEAYETLGMTLYASASSEPWETLIFQHP